jgi:hypothetical protein
VTRSSFGKLAASRSICAALMLQRAAGHRPALLASIPLRGERQDATKGGWTTEGVFSLFIAKNNPNCNSIRRDFSARNPQKPAKMIPVMVGSAPVKYRLGTGYDRLSTGKVPVMVSYGRLRKLRGIFRPRNQPLSTNANPVLSAF